MSFFPPVYTEAVLCCSDPWRGDLFEDLLFPHNSIVRLPGLGLYYGEDPDQLCRHVYDLRDLRPDATLFAASHEECKFWPDGQAAQAVGSLVVDALRQARMKTVGAHIDESRGIDVDGGAVRHSFLNRLWIKAAQFPAGGHKIDCSKSPTSVTVGARYFLGQPKFGDIRLIARFIDERVITTLAKLFGGVMPAFNFLGPVRGEERERIQSLVQQCSLAAV